jgi:heme A synthase
MLYSSLIASGTILFSIIFGALCVTIDGNKTVIICHLIAGWIMLSIFLIGLAIYPLINNPSATL